MVAMRPEVQNFLSQFQSFNLRMPKVDSFVLMTVEVEGVDDCKKN